MPVIHGATTYNLPSCQHMYLCMTSLSCSYSLQFELPYDESRVNSVGGYPVQEVVSWPAKHLGRGETGEKGPTTMATQSVLTISPPFRVSISAYVLPPGGTVLPNSSNVCDFHCSLLF